MYEPQLLLNFILNYKEINLPQETLCRWNPCQKSWMPRPQKSSGEKSGHIITFILIRFILNQQKHVITLGNTSYNKNRFLSSIAQITSPQFGQLVPLFFDVKNDVLGRITTK